MVSVGLMVLMASAVLLALSTGILLGYVMFADEDGGTVEVVAHAAPVPAPAVVAETPAPSGIIDDVAEPTPPAAGPLSLEDFAGFGEPGAGEAVEPTHEPPPPPPMEPEPLDAPDPEEEAFLEAAKAKPTQASVDAVLAKASSDGIPVLPPPLPPPDEALEVQSEDIDQMREAG